MSDSPVFRTIEEITEIAGKGPVIVDGKPVAAGTGYFGIVNELQSDELGPVEQDLAYRLIVQLKRDKARQTLREQLALSDRERALIVNCRQYAGGEPAGLPGHNLMLLVAKLAEALGVG